MRGWGRDGQSRILGTEIIEKIQLISSGKIHEKGWTRCGENKKSQNKAFKKLKTIQVGAEITKNADKSDSEETR